MTKPSDRAIAPWPDFKGRPIRHGDRMQHPDGMEFTAIHVPGADDPHDAWRAVYVDPKAPGCILRLGLQVGDKGQAFVIDAAAPEGSQGVEPIGYIGSFDADFLREKIAGQVTCLISKKAPNKRAVAIYTTPPQPTEAAFEQLSETDKDIAVAQAVELATYVERQAKGEMVKAAQQFLSLPYSQKIATRLTESERYRWLRDRALNFERESSGHGTPWCVIGMDLGDAEPLYGSSLDAVVDECMTIDAARAAGGGGGGGGDAD